MAKTVKMADMLLDALSEYVLFVDPQMRIQWANRAAVESAGLDLSSLHERHCYEIWHNRQETCPECPVSKVFETGQPQQGEVTSPEKKSWSIRGYPIRDDQGKLTGAAEIAVDITALKQTQEALEESETKYSTLVEQAKDAIVIVQDGVGKFFNQAALDIFGYTREELLDRPFQTLLAEESREEVETRYKTRLSGDTPPNFYEARAVHKSGRKLDFELSVATIQYQGRPAVLGIARDITERKRAEEALRDSEAKYSVLVENAQDAIVILQDEVCKFINQAAREIFGYTIEELQNRSFLELVAPESREAVLSHYQARFSGKDARPRLHYARIIHKDGTTRDVESTGALIEYQGNPAILGIFRDVTDRKRTQETLRAEKDKMQVLLDGLARAEIGIDIIGVDYKIRYQNEAIQEAFGDLVGKLCYEAYMGQNAPCTPCPMADSIRNNQPESVELTGIDGKDYQVLSAPLPNQDGTVDKAIEIVLGITERKQAEEALRASEQFSSSLLNSAPNGIIVINPDTSVQYVNRALEELTGLAAEEIVGRKAPYPWWTEETLQKTAKDLQDAMGAGASRLEELFRKKNGERFWVEIFSVRVERDGEFKYYVANWVDITERKRAEQALRDSEERYRTLVQTSPDAIVMTDMNNQLVMVNQQTAQLLGFDSAEEVLEKVDNVFEYIDREYQETAQRKFEEYDQTWGTRASVYRLVRRDKSAVMAEVNSSVITDVDGNLSGAISVIRDITDRMLAEEERRKLHEQIQHAQKLESLGILAGGIAHDFNNLLMGVLGNASLALLDLPAGSPVRHSVEQIEKTARAAADLTNQMLAYSGKGRFVVEAVDLSRLVEEMAGLLKVSISKKVTLKFDFDRDLSPVEADATQLRQVIMNLIINASEAIGEKAGVVSVRTGTTEADRSFFAETYTHDDLPEGTYVYLEVSDTGCGMDKETIGRVFDPFFTTKFTGRGLGLAAVLGIIRGHKGAVRVQSEPGQGATIQVVFPPYAGDDQVAAPEPESEKLRKASGKILVVDDEATICDVSRRMLQSSGFEVITAGNGREALEIFQKQGDEIAGVLLDATMPEMDGLETFEELRRIRQDVRVVLSSGYSEQEATERFTGKGLTGFIQKPYRFDDLIDKMQEILGK